MKFTKAVAIATALVLTIGTAVLIGAPSGDAQCSYNDAILGTCGVATDPNAGDPRPTCDYNDLIVGNDCAEPIAYSGPFAPIPADLGDLPIELGPLAGVPAVAPSLVDGVATITFPQELLDRLNLERNVLVEYNPIVFDGKLPPDGKVSFDYPTNRESIQITVTANLLTGALYLETITLRLADATSAAAAGVVAGSPSPVAIANTAAATVPAASPGLAVTGLNADIAATGLMLLGLGAGAAGAARLGRRRD